MLARAWRRGPVCVRVYARVLVPPNLYIAYIHIHMSYIHIYDYDVFTHDKSTPTKHFNIPSPQQQPARSGSHRHRDPPTTAPKRRVGVGPV